MITGRHSQQRTALLVRVNWHRHTSELPHRHWQWAAHLCTKGCAPWPRKGGNLHHLCCLPEGRCANNAMPFVRSSSRSSLASRNPWLRLFSVLLTNARHILQGSELVLAVTAWLRIRPSGVASLLGTRSAVMALRRMLWLASLSCLQLSGSTVLGKQRGTASGGDTLNCEQFAKELKTVCDMEKQPDSTSPCHVVEMWKATKAECLLLGAITRSLQPLTTILYQAQHPFEPPLPLATRYHFADDSLRRAHPHFWPNL